MYTGYVGAAIKPGLPYDAGACIASGNTRVEPGYNQRFLTLAKTLYCFSCVCVCVVLLYKLSVRSSYCVCICTVLL